MSKLDVFLVNAGFDAASRLSKLASTKLSTQVMQGALKLFLKAYSRLYDEVMDPRNKYEFPATIMGRSVEEIETLLDID
jgi:hypothetical protein